MAKKLKDSLSNEVILDLYNSGISAGKIAENLSVSAGTIKKRLQKMGIKLRPPSFYQKISIDTGAIDLTNIHASAKKIGVSPTVIKREISDIQTDEYVDWKQIEEDVKRYLAYTRSYDETSRRFNIAPHRIQAKNNRSWRIKIRKNIEYSKDEIKELLEKHKSYDAVSKITGLKYNTIRSINNKYAGVKINKNYRIGKTSTDIYGASYRSMFECHVANALIVNGIKFERQKRLCTDRRWTCDFYIPDGSLYIEVDGLGVQRADFESSVFSESEKMRFYKENRLNLCIVSNTIQLRRLIERLPKSSFEFKKHMVECREIKYKQAHNFVKLHHYSGTTPRGSKYLFGFFIGNILCGVVTFGSGSNKSLIKGVAGENYSGVELTRLCALESVKGNFESYMIGKALRLLKKKEDIVVSFSDIFHNHIGTIYQASNFIYTGKTAKDYMYKMPHNVFFHKSKFRCKNGLVEKELAKNCGAVKFELPSKHRYVYVVNKKKEKEILANLKYKICEYPKNHASLS